MHPYISVFKYWSLGLPDTLYLMDIGGTMWYYVMYVHLMLPKGMSPCQGRRWAEALAIFAAMPLAKVAANVISYGAAMSACEKAAKWQEAGGVRSCSRCFMLPDPFKDPRILGIPRL